LGLIKRSELVIKYLKYLVKCAILEIYSKFKSGREKRVTTYIMPRHFWRIVGICKGTCMGSSSRKDRDKR
jgi:hypothetical protein